MSKKKCPICGAEMKIDTSSVCTSIPPKYRCVCPSCNCLDFIETSEYDQYKDEPSLPSNLDEAAEEYGRKEYSHAIHFWDEGLSKNKPEVMKEDFVNAFKAGAEWQKEQDQETIELAEEHAMLAGRMQMKEEMMKDAVEADVNKYEDLAAGKSWAEFIVEMSTNKLGDKVRIIIVKEEE